MTKMFRLFLALNIAVGIFIIFLSTDCNLVLISAIPFFKNSVGKPHIIHHPKPLILPEYTIDTPGCQIPLHPPLHPKTLQNPRKQVPSAYTCRGPQLFSIDMDTLVINFTEMNQWKIKHSGMTCEYAPFHHDKGDTIHYHLPFIKIETDTQLKDDFVKLQCMDERGILVYQDFFATFPFKTAVEQRVKEFKKINQYKKESKLSVLLLGIDGVSRNEYKKLFTRTDKFLRRKVSVIKLHGYNKIGGHTAYSRMLPLLTGKYEHEYPEQNYIHKSLDHFPFIWKEFEKQGYRTIFAEDDPYRNTFNYYKIGFEKPPTDYYLRPLTVAAEESNLKTHAYPHVCFPNRSESEVMLQWMGEFFDEFGDEPSFAYVFFQRLREYITDVGDDLLLETFQNFYSGHHFDNTIVFFFSSHGYRFGDRKISPIEGRLPFFNILLPKWFKFNYPKIYNNIFTNQNRLVTGFDIHATLLDIATVFKSNKLYPVISRSMSLFGPIYSYRTCQIANIPQLYCMCSEKQQVFIDDIVIEAGQELVNYINGMVFESKSVCLKDLTMSRIIEVTSEEMSSFNISQTIYTLIVETDKKSATFQGVVRFNKDFGNFTVDKEIDRLDAYVESSDCISEPNFKPYCICH